MNTDTIIEFLEKEERIKFDERVRYDIDFEEAFDENAWEEFIQLSDIREPVHKTNILRSLKAVVVENDRMYLTNAGVLFFTKSPSKYIPQAPVRCIAFKTDERTEIYDTKTFDENIISMIKSGVSFIERYTYSSRIIEGTEAKNKPELPTVALREAVVNAVIHRDYFETGANVVIEIFPRKIKITNPGGLPKGMHPEEFGEFSLARNPLTASIMQHTPYMEKFGTGISRIRKQLKDAGLKQALFEFRNFFSLTFFRDEPSREDVRHDEPLNEPSRENVRYDEPLSEPSRENVRHDEPLSVTDFEMQVLAIIHNNNEITKAELAEQTGKSRASVTRAVKQLRLNNLLSSKGRGRNFVWIVNE
jgi:ATP-dependent DNA helicase RecG